MGIEIALMKVFYSFRHGLLTEAMIQLTALGSTVFASVLITGLFLKDQQYFGKITAISYGLTSAIVYPMKLVFSRTRPEIAENIIHTTTTYSFPSGHTAGAFVLATMLSYKIPEMDYFFFGLAAFIGISRIYLGVHYPSDVLIGGLIGFGAGKLVLKNQDMISPLIRMGGKS